MTKRFFGLEALDEEGRVLVSKKTARIYEPRLREGDEAQELLDRFQWNRLDVPNGHKRRTVFGYFRLPSPLLESHNPPTTGISWVNTAPFPVPGAGDRLTATQIARRGIYVNERTTDMRLIPVQALSLLAARQWFMNKTGVYVGEGLPVYGFDTVAGKLGGLALITRPDPGAINARRVMTNEESINNFLKIFEFPGAAPEPSVQSLLEA